MITEELISEVSNQYGFTRLKFKTGKATWLHNNAVDGIEFNGFHIVPFKIIESERVYDEDKINPETVKVIKLIEAENAKETGAFKGDIQEPKEPKEEPKQEEPKQEFKRIPAKEPKEHNKLQIGDFSALAKQYNFPIELANLFFMKIDNKLYIKNPGLLYLASKKGYGHIEVKEKFNETSKEWEAECEIYPLVSVPMMEAIGKLDKEVQLKALEMITKPTNGKGRAGDKNIKMSTMKIFAQELAQTRAQNRALRAYTGYGGTSAEEREDVSEIEFQTG